MLMWITKPAFQTNRVTIMTNPAQVQDFLHITAFPCKYLPNHWQEMLLWHWGVHVCMCAKIHWTPFRKITTAQSLNSYDLISPCYNNIRTHLSLKNFLISCKLELFWSLPNRPFNHNKVAGSVLKWYIYVQGRWWRCIEKAKSSTLVECQGWPVIVSV